MTSNPGGQGRACPASRVSPDCRDLFAKLDLDMDGILTEAEFRQGRPLVAVALPWLATATDAERHAHLTGLDAPPTAR